ncbi:MAG: glycosyltransferase [Alphaproteobacteria bacterium]|nr:glycosyltransferase [Alphaproteobacteria bacterium]
MSSAPADIAATLAEANAAALAGKRAHAIALYGSLIAQPGAPMQAHVNLVATLVAANEPREALGAADVACAAFPGESAVAAVAGEAALAAGFPVRAARNFETALSLGGLDARRLGNLALALQGQGRIAEALDTYARARTLAPADARLASNALMCAHYDPPDSPEAALARAREWPRPAAPARPAARDPRPDRALRVGYASPDFCNHSCSYFLVPLLAGHDRNSVEIHAYSDVAAPDGLTAAFRNLVPNWHETAGLDDAAFARRVESDGIDVLVDCAGHTNGNRLGAFALRPAPVQATWLGFPGTTGLDVFDARLVDEITDPTGVADAASSEPLARVPGGFLAYMPPPFAPAVSPAPMRLRGYPTFGSFNNLPKITAATLDLWSAALHAVPASRMVVKARGLDEAETRERLLAGFAARGIDRARVELAGFAQTLQSHVARYADIDVALDTVPYNGTTTTCEALWMGVPVLSLAGDRHAGRVSASLLARIGAGGWVARDSAGLAKLAASLVSDALALETIRAGLRARVAGSPLCDGLRLARAFEGIYRRLWRQVVSPPAMV